MSSISRRRNGLMALSVIGGLLSWVRLKAPQSQDRTPASGYSTCCHQLPRERFSPLPLKRPCRRDRGTARSGGNASFPISPAPICPSSESGRSLPETRTPDAAPISALPLVGRKAEGYHRRRGVAASLSRGSPHGHSGVATWFGP